MYRQSYRAKIFQVTLVFLLLTLTLFFSLIFGLTDCLVRLAEKSLDNLISRRIHDHYLKSFSVELKTAP